MKSLRDRRSGRRAATTSTATASSIPARRCADWGWRDDPAGTIRRVLLGAVVLLGGVAWPRPQRLQTPAHLPSRRRRQPPRPWCAQRTNACWSGRAIPAASSPLCPRASMLDAVARDAQWIEVRLPRDSSAVRADQRGFVFAATSLCQRPRPVGTSEPFDAATRGARRDGSGATTPARPAFRHPWLRRRRVYQWFTAADSFKAILDTSGGLFYGGGAQVHFGPIYVDVGVSRFEKTGERAFVFEGDVFRRRHPRSHHDDAACRDRRLPLPHPRPHRPLPRWRRGVAEIRGDVGLRRSRRERQRALHELSRGGAAWSMRPPAGCSSPAKCATRRCPTRWARRGSPPISTSRTSAAIRWR